MTPPLELATRCARSLSMRRTLAGWSRSLSAPTRRPRRISALCEWVSARPGLPRLRQAPPFGCLGEVLGDLLVDGNGWDDSDPAPTAAATVPSSAKRRTRRPATSVVARDRPTARPRETAAPRQHEPAPCPPAEAAKPRTRKPPAARPEIVPACPGKPAPCPVPAAPPEDMPARPRQPPCPVPAGRAERRLLCRLAGEPEPEKPAPPRAAVPVPPVTRSRPRPAPCSPAAPWTAATNRVVRRLRPATTPEPQEPPPAPARRPVAGPTATAGLLYRYAAGQQGAAAARVVDDTGAERHRGHPVSASRTRRPVAATGVAHRPTATNPVHRDDQRGVPRAGSVPPLDRDEAPVPVAPPTASERLGPAPLTTTSHPALVEPDPVGAPTIPVAGATLRQGAARDAAAPEFLDGADLTRRIAQVLRDEARRHGIEV